MKTRDYLYSREAAEVLRIVSTYKTLAYEQILKMFPGKKDKIRTILGHLIKQARVFNNRETGIVSDTEDGVNSPDTELITSFWVLIDFIDRAEYHTIGEFPVKISYFADGEMYEIVYARVGYETGINRAFRDEDNNPPRRIIVLQNLEQAKKITIPNTAGFCIVNDDGQVSYYKPEV
jgi:hypothetical protein